MIPIENNLKLIHQKIADAALKAGRKPEEIELIAVSKTHSPESIREALDAGHFLFGENRVQEARAKIPLLPSQARWHFIGHLQKNKIRQALSLFECFHGIDSSDLANEMNRVATETGVFPRMLLEVNVAGEASKFGFRPDALRAQMDSLLAKERLQIEGLMCIPPMVKDAEDARRFFVRLRELRDTLQSEFQVKLPQLSMGMSGDFQIAIEEGATMVRIGTTIFGTRRGKAWKPESGELE